MNEPGQAEGDISGIGVDPVAFEAFYRQHLEAVGRFVARRVNDPHLAADLTADVFLAVVESAAGYRPDRGSQIGWLFGVARNVIGDERRRAAQRLRVTGRLAGRRDLSTDDIARIEERIDAESAARRTHRALSGLPEGTRALVELVAVDGLTVAEAATVLGMSPVAARVRLHRARRLVRAVLARPATTLA
ncbi:sigma-70 family RNA polymerase sigma factor [Micromonospora sp. NPDC005413]|uniref:RNA polymerase sigma factor n=1 Tax=Micromonospora sp. NPDC005413 TaxID=3154563 RepID=UPI0033B3CD05